MRTYSPSYKNGEAGWHLIDANGKILGKTATEIATLLMGKNKPTFARHLPVGDHVVVVNAEKVVVTGRKEKQKMYYRFSGYPGGLRVTSLKQMRSEHPERILLHAVSGMLPKNKLQDVLLKRLHIYASENHPYKDKFSGGTKAK